MLYIHERQRRRGEKNGRKRRTLECRSANLGARAQKGAAGAGRASPAVKPLQLIKNKTHSGHVNLIGAWDISAGVRCDETLSRRSFLSTKGVSGAGRGGVGGGGTLQGSYPLLESPVFN